MLSSSAAVLTFGCRPPVSHGHAANAARPLVDGQDWGLRVRIKGAFSKYIPGKWKLTAMPWRVQLAKKTQGGNIHQVNSSQFFLLIVNQSNLATWQHVRFINNPSPWLHAHSVPKGPINPSLLRLDSLECNRWTLAEWPFVSPESH